MKRLVHIILILFYSNYFYSQCNIDFGSTANKLSGIRDLGSLDVVHNTSTSSERTWTQSFNIWNETANPPDCTTSGGADDITMDFNILSIADAYGGSTMNEFAGVSHDITYQTSGLTGRNVLGDAASNRTTTGDYRGYSVKVRFASHVDISASEFAVRYTSGNTAGTAYESTVIQFLDESGAPFGTATYLGYYTQAAIVTACPSTSIPGTVRPSPWSLSGIGVFAAQSTGTTQPDSGPNYCSSINGSNGPDNGNNKIITATSTGISGSTKIGGFIFMTYLEDIRANINDNTWSSTSTSFTSTLNGFDVTVSPFSIDLVSFEATNVGKSNVLKWTTASEKDNVGFEIERSRDGYQFEKIGFVAGNLNSSTLQYYQFIDDKLVENRYYYRLKAVDKFGNTDFSEIRTVSTKLENKLFIQPTLVTDWLEINTNSTTNGKIILNDINGATLNQIEVEKDSQFKMNVSDLVSGIYFIHFVDELGNHTSQKFIKN